jgi:hypothetical protein
MVLSNLSVLIKQKLVTYVLLLMVFAAQSLLPTVMACQMPDQAPATDPVLMTNHAEMDHTTHFMAEDTQSHAMSGDDCCQLDCSCPTGSCSAVAVVTTSNADEVHMSSQKIALLSARLIVQSPNLPFRPPIFA